MPRPRKNKMYFTQETEDAIIAYNKSKSDRERNQIYRDSIQYPFDKLAENVLLFDEFLSREFKKGNIDKSFFKSKEQPNIWSFGLLYINFLFLVYCIFSCYNYISHLFNLSISRSNILTIISFKSMILLSCFICSSASCLYCSNAVTYLCSSCVITYFGCFLIFLIVFQIDQYYPK